MGSLPMDTSLAPLRCSQLADSAFMLIFRAANCFSLEVAQRGVKIASAETDGIGPDMTAPPLGKNINKSFHTLTLRS